MMIRSFKRSAWPLRICSVALLLLPRLAWAGAVCPGDADGDNIVTIDELVLGIENALHGCGSNPGPSPSCGDGEAQSDLGEECDGQDLVGESCESLGFQGGNLECTFDCKYNTVSCWAGGGLLKTGQTKCDQGNFILGEPPPPCSPPGQDRSAFGVALSYEDNGDGTITDIVTGLIWEKLSKDGSIHDVDTFYPWSEAITVKISNLNTNRFAGHDDWRLPNRRELESLTNAGRFAPAVDPVFNALCTSPCSVTTCSCTQADAYWTSTSHQELAEFAWAINFNYGDVTYYKKLEGSVIQGSKKGSYVRAVRGGR